MFPHVIGWFPMVAAWVIICNHLEETKRDLALITDRKIPDWVDAVVRTHTFDRNVCLPDALRSFVRRSTAPSWYEKAELEYAREPA